jgi:hypothetical protein
VVAPVSSLLLVVGFVVATAGWVTWVLSPSRGGDVPVECLDHELGSGAANDGGICAGTSARQPRDARRRRWGARQLLERLERRG